MQTIQPSTTAGELSQLSRGTVTPPDQALCVGNGYLLEAVNTLVKLRRTADGQQVGRTLLLSQFLGAASTPAFEYFDPVCESRGARTWAPALRASAVQSASS